jgi:hypothetical protein
MAALEFTPPQQTSAAAPAMDMGDFAELVRSPRHPQSTGPRPYRADRRSSSSFVIRSPRAPPARARSVECPPWCAPDRPHSPPPFPQPSGLFEAARETD